MLTKAWNHKETMQGILWGKGFKKPNEQRERSENLPREETQCYSPANHNHGQSNSKPIIISQEDSF